MNTLKKRFYFTMWRPKISAWMLFWMSLSSLLVVSVLSIFFYSAFQRALDERVLLQLTSIKRLKKVQIEAYLKREWASFSKAVALMEQSTNHEIILIDTSQLHKIGLENGLAFSGQVAGIYDVSPGNDSGELSLLIVQSIGSEKYAIQFLSGEAIQQILLERTGMGNSGESYLVGNDYHLRSLSRFFPEEKPYRFMAETEGVKRGFMGQEGTGIFPDYRDVMVYSSFQRIAFQNLDWVILSEMDVGEVQAPLLKLKGQLMGILVFVFFFAILISYFVAKAFSRPILQIKRHLYDMAEGNYDIVIEESRGPRELGALFSALKDLKASIKGAINFSHQIGQMDLSADFAPSGESDKLGHSLLNMRQQLVEFHRLKEENNTANKKSFLNGQEKERSRLAKELHDGLGPLLTSLKISVLATDLPSEQKQPLKQLIDEMILEVRRMTYDLMPQALLDFGVGKAIINLTELIKKTSDLNVHYINSMNEESGEILGLEKHINLFRITQELLNNTLKHAKASSVRLSLTQFENKVALYYKDDGKGFDPDKVQQGYGLNNIKERVSVFNGYFSLKSDSSGTEVEVEIPIRNG